MILHESGAKPSAGWYRAILSRLGWLARAEVISAIAACAAAAIAFYEAYGASQDAEDVRVQLGEARLARRATEDIAGSARSSANAYQEQADHLRRLIETADQQRAALERASRAAEAQVGALKEESARTWRPRISIRSVSLGDMIVGQAIRQDFKAENTGKEEPHQIRMASHSFFSETDPPLPEFPDCDTSVYRFDRISAFGQGNFYARTPWSLDAGTLKKYRDARLVYTTWAAICYDPSDGSVHRTTVCVTFDAKGRSDFCKPR
ncbi:hypothetical protein [Methylobacterium planeticum]|uniref:Uncharacterized protein n=1 Tax=Methylobacterium planeticum TaxID=2615211 RepID=A0A6N6MWK9_9HYPH|nr:hypothetical protein [Methylobacterium planeticum]KAB1076061.1 hypothetical protein F6X51_00530 [Methylobacterium planeticum]